MNVEYATQTTITFDKSKRQHRRISKCIRATDEICGIKWNQQHVRKFCSTFGGTEANESTTKS